IAIGYNPIEYEPALWNRQRNRDLIHVDVLRADVDRDYRPSVELTGDIAATVRSLTASLRTSDVSIHSSLLDEIARDRMIFNERAAVMSGAPIHPMRLVKELQDLLSDDMTLCLDMGSFHIWL